MTQAQSLNKAYEDWKKASAGEEERLQLLLVKSLEKLALSICWKKIPDLQGEFPWVVNESMYRALEGASSFKGRSTFSVWYYRIVVNECNRLLKRHVRTKATTVSLDTSGVLDSQHATGTGLEISEAIRALGWSADVLVRLKSEGFSTREIAGMLDTTEAAVKMRWSRLKGRLRYAG